MPGDLIHAGHLAGISLQPYGQYLYARHRPFFNWRDALAFQRCAPQVWDRARISGAKGRGELTVQVRRAQDAAHRQLPVCAPRDFANEAFL
jgi:hypothetical protein